MTFLILYETQAGTTQFVASLLQKHLQALGHQITLHQVSVDGQPDLGQYQGLIVGAPTYHHGQIDFNMANFLEEFKPNLNQKTVGAFGLGDSMYDEYCTSADVLQEWLKSRGGKPKVQPLKIDGYPDDENVLQKWVDSLLKPT
jgi:flavodoxin I